LNIVPLEWLRWGLLSFSGLVSLCVIVAELWRCMREKLGGPNFLKFIFTVAFLIFSHSILILALKRYFLA
jgi:hypothetical protein